MKLMKCQIMLKCVKTHESRLSIKICKSIINNKNNQQNMFVTLIDTRLVTL